MPSQYDLEISVAGFARAGVFGLLDQAARMRRLAAAGQISRSFAISQARSYLATAYVRDRIARTAGFRLA